MYIKVYFISASVGQKVCKMAIITSKINQVTNLAKGTDDDLFCLQFRIINISCKVSQV